ncbi:MAG: alpha/beta hydrolase [Terracidiphilus sp.]
MTRFLDVRLQPVGGAVAHQVALFSGTSIDNYTGVTLPDFKNFIQGQHVLIGAHGFNVDRADGVSSLSGWEGLLQLPQSSVFAGLLWPGDSIWAHGLDYPSEASVADQAGQLIGSYIETNFAAAASISFVSHSLGARVVLAAISNMQRRVRRLTLMAGAIDNDCLTNEYGTVPDTVDSISLLASNGDTVLSELFPLGNFFAGILDEGHPWVRSALGHRGPAGTAPANFEPPYQIPDGWSYNHGDYLKVIPPAPPKLAIPTDVPGVQSGPPAALLDPQGNPLPNWKAAFSSAFASTRFR